MIRIVINATTETKMKMYVYINQSFIEDFLRGDFAFCLDISSAPPEKHSVYSSAIPAGEIDLELDIDAMQVRQAAILGIEREETELRAVMSGKLNQLETRRQQLLALEHKND